MKRSRKLFVRGNLQLLSPADIAQRIAAGETTSEIFYSGGRLKAKLLGPEGAVSAISDTDRSIDFAISTEAVDRYTDIVSLGGWRTQNYARNPVVLWAHDDSIPAIARGGNVRVEGKALRSTAVFAEREAHPLADTVYQLLKGKFLSAASVGFVPLKAKAAAGKDRPFGLDIIEQELLEWSVVNIPANPECLSEARSLGIDTSPLIGWAERVLDRGDVLLIPRAEIEALRKAAGAPTIVGAGLKPAPTAHRGQSAPTRRVKSLWHISWLADILMDTDCLQDCVAWEEEYEGDGSDIGQRLTDALKALGAILIDMTIEEVTELLAQEAAEIVQIDPMGLSATQKRLQVLRLLTKAKRPAIDAALTALAPTASKGFIDLMTASLTKAGRVLSAENEKKLRDAHDCVRTAMVHCEKACGHVMSVVEQAVSVDDPDPDDDDPDNDENEDNEERARERRERRIRQLKLSSLV